MKAVPALLPLAKEFADKNPESAARTLETLDELQASDILSELPDETAAGMFPHFQLVYASKLLSHLSPERLSSMIAAIDPKRAATIFMHMADPDRERFVPFLPDKLKWQVQELLTYPEGSVGRIMLATVYHFPKATTVQEVTNQVRRAHGRRVPSSYVYVVKDDDTLIGVVSMYELLVASPEATLSSLMSKDVFAIHCFASIEDAGQALAKRRYSAAPVVDGENKLLGVVRAAHLIAGAQNEVATDMQSFFGAGREERPFSKIAFSLKTRLPWLHINLLTAFMAAGVIALFEDVIARITVLAIFLPVIAGQGGNAGAQSLAIVMRGLVMREVPQNRYTALIFKEGALGIVNGVIIGAVTALVAWAYKGNPFLGVVVGLGMVVNLLCAGLAGAAIPLTMKRLGFDPAQSSNILLTTVTDVVGFFAFLGFAMLFEGFLVN